MFEGAKVEGSEGSVLTNRNEDVGSAGEPGYVVLVRVRRRREWLGGGREGEEGEGGRTTSRS